MNLEQSQQNVKKNFLALVIKLKEKGIIPQELKLEDYDEEIEYH